MTKNKTNFVYLFISNISEIAIDILKCDNDWLFAWFADLRANFFCFRIAFWTEMVLKITLLLENSKIIQLLKSSYLFNNKLGINFAVWAAVLKSEMTTFWTLFEFGLIFLEIFNVNFIPTGTLVMLSIYCQSLIGWHSQSPILIGRDRLYEKLSVKLAGMGSNLDGSRCIVTFMV